MVHYRWHALFGRRLRVERVDRRRSGQFVHVEVLPGVFTVVAAWMLDPLVCIGMELGVPRVSLAALSDLDDLLNRRGLRRSSCGDITAAQEQTDAKPASQTVFAEAIADAVRPSAAERDGRVGGQKSGRGGRALLSGMLTCGRCGRGLAVAYTGAPPGRPTYRCDRPNLMLGLPRCLGFGGSRV